MKKREFIILPAEAIEDYESYYTYEAAAKDAIRMDVEDCVIVEVVADAKQGPVQIQRREK